MDDRHASVAMAAGFDELLHLRDGFDGRLAVQVERVAWGEIAALDLSELAAIDAGRDVSLLRSDPIVMSCCRS